MSGIKNSIVSRVTALSGSIDSSIVDIEIIGVAEWVISIARGPEWRSVGLPEVLIEKVLIPKAVHNINIIKARNDKNADLLNLLLNQRDSLDNEYKKLIKEVII